MVGPHDGKAPTAPYALTMLQMDDLDDVDEPYPISSSSSSLTNPRMPEPARTSAAAATLPRLHVLNRSGALCHGSPTTPMPLVRFGGTLSRAPSRQPQLTHREMRPPISRGSSNTSRRAFDLQRPDPHPLLIIDQPPPYLESGPPPIYDEESDGEDPASHHHMRKGIRTCGSVSWWVILIATLDVLLTFILLFMTLARLTTHPKSFSPLPVILPFIYVFLAGHGRACISSRQRLIGQAFYATMYLMRVIMDTVALALFISWEDRMSDAEEESIGLLDDNFPAGPFMYLMEVVRWPVAGMRVAQYADREQCGMSEDACTWRVGAWAGMLVFHITLSALLFIHVYHTRVRIGRKRAKMQEHLQTDSAPEMTPVIAERACSYYHFPNDIFPPRPIQRLAISTLPRNDGVPSATEENRDEDDLPLATFLHANENRRTTGCVQE